MLACSFPIYLLSQQVLRSEIFATPRALDADITQPPCDNATTLPPPLAPNLEHMACANGCYDASLPGVPNRSLSQRRTLLILMQRRGTSHRYCLIHMAAHCEEGAYTRAHRENQGHE